MNMLEDIRKQLDKWIPNEEQRVIKKIGKLILLPIAWIKIKFSTKVNIETLRKEKVEDNTPVVEKLNFITTSMLNNTIYKNISKIPKDVDLVVGIPRSGLLVANLIALYLNVKLTDIEGLRDNKIFNKGNTSKCNNEIKDISECRKILVVDDSVFNGDAINKAKEELRDFSYKEKLIFMTVYTTEHGKDKVDIYFEICNPPRMFEWNLMRHNLLEKCCFDIDGVLCVDPTYEQNSDEKKYDEFLKTATPLFLPNKKIGHLVTSRLEKNRALTEQWMDEHGIQYGNLKMMPYKNREERMRANNHAEHKAEYYKNTDALLFVESSYIQAVKIAEIAKKPVFCIETQQIIN